MMYFRQSLGSLKKINVKPFDSEKETKDCIEKPLKGLGVRTQDIFDFETYSEIDAIHNLSGGRPYEIQLLCHQLFKSVQQGRASKLQLSVDVLDDVLNELQTLQDVSIRPMVQKIRSLNNDELMALGVLLMSNNLVTFEQAWYFEHVFNEGTRWTKITLKEKLDTLVQKNLIKVENEVLSFAGDDFDRIYCKYYSRKQGAIANINDIPLNVRLKIGIDISIRKNKPKIEISNFYVNYSEDFNFEEVLLDFSNQSFQLSEKNIRLTERLYKINLENQDLMSFPVIYLFLRTPWGMVNSCFTIDNHQTENNADSYLIEFERIFKPIKEKATEANSELGINMFLVPVIPIEQISNKMLEIDSQKFKEKLANIHIEEMYECYTKLQDIDGAIFHADLALMFSPLVTDINAANNLGYLYLANGDIEKAKLLFEQAQKLALSSFEDETTFPSRDEHEFWEAMEALVEYNLGIVCAMQGDLARATNLIGSSIEKSQKIQDTQCACLFIAEKNEDQITFREIQEPDLLTTAKASAEAIRSNN